MHWPVTVAVLLLLAIGVCFVYSSCYNSEDQHIRLLYRRQILWSVVGMVCYVAFAAGDYRRLRRWSWWVYGGCLVLLLAVLFVGTERYGARRWLVLFGVNLQPSELTKLALIIVLARRLGRPGMYYGEFRRITFVLMVIAAPVALILVEPDLGTAMVFAPAVLIILYSAGVPLRTLGVLVGIAVVLIGLALAGVLLPEIMDLDTELQDKLRSLSGLSEYQRNRVLVFFGLDEDPLGAGWNRLQSEIAVGSGGMWGKGYLNGTQNILGFLPRKVAFNDFIYSVIAEETGFAGSAAILALFGVILWGGVKAAMVARDKMGRLLCMGVVAMLFCHVFINIGMTVGLMPITGLPLPLLSYGGSFMIVVMSSLGMLQSVYIRSRRVIY